MFILLIHAAFFLKIQLLIDLMIHTVADTLKDMSLEDIREKFKIQNDRMAMDTQVECVPHPQM